jgi:hypothetical protein
MNAEKLTLEDGLMMRTLADSPGGLELHIGVRCGVMLPAAMRLELLLLPVLLLSYTTTITSSVMPQQTQSYLLSSCM